MSAGNFWENSLQRREFVGAFAAAALAGVAVGSSAIARTAPAAPAESEGVPFSLSVMLWTIYRDLPFEQRLEKVAEAGYKNVELVGEYQKWSEADYERANAKRKELGISFDATAGLKHGVANPADR